MDYDINKLITTSLAEDFISANANDDRMMRSIRAFPDRYLRDATIIGHDIKFKTVLTTRTCSQKGLNAALFYATGFGRDDYMRRLIGEGAKLSEVVNGVLLYHVMNGDMGGVRHSIREGADVSAHNDECFKQAVLGNHIRIADLLHAHGANITSVMSDQRFCSNLWDIETVTSDTREYVAKVVGTFDFTLDEPLSMADRDFAERRTLLGFRL